MVSPSASKRPSLGGGGHAGRFAAAAKQISTEALSHCGTARRTTRRSSIDWLCTLATPAPAEPTRPGHTLKDCRASGFSLRSKVIDPLGTLQVRARAGLY